MITNIIFLLLVAGIVLPYWLKVRKHHHRSATITSPVKGSSPSAEPVTLHPKIDISKCIGCGSCVEVCPEKVLGLVDGHAAIVNGVHCVGHSLCEGVCPVGAITMGFGSPREGMEIPFYDDKFETNLSGLFIAGELGGIGLIRNAIHQGVTAIDVIAGRSAQTNKNQLDVIIVGAGPAGLASALEATSRHLRYLVLEQTDLGGSILHYPRQKLVLTQPVELPLFGKIKGPEISKEELLSLFQGIVERQNLCIKTGEKVQQIQKSQNTFSVQTSSTTYETNNVILAMGRRGTPKKLSVPGEGLPKVMYKLIEAEHYQNKHILVVGGGDSAIEAVAALSIQRGNKVWLSYRRDSFVRLKEKNQKRITDLISGRKIDVLFESQVVGIEPDAVQVTLKGESPVVLKNDFVFIFAGGDLPTEFLKKTGIRLRGGDD